MLVPAFRPLHFVQRRRDKFCLTGLGYPPDSTGHPPRSGNISTGSRRDRGDKRVEVKAKIAIPRNRVTEWSLTP